MKKFIRPDSVGCVVRSNCKLNGCLLVALLLLVSQAFAAQQPPLTHGLKPVTPSRMAPALRLKNMDEQIVDIASLRGRVIVVNFWATWCPPCRREMGSLERLHLATADKGVVVLAVNIGEDLDTVFSFMGKVDPAPTFPILFDTDATSLETWKVMGLPTTFVVDPAGRIVYRAVGGREFDHPDIVNKILALAKGASQEAPDR